MEWGDPLTSWWSATCLARGNECPLLAAVMGWLPVQGLCGPEHTRRSLWKAHYVQQIKDHCRLLERGRKYNERLQQAREVLHGKVDPSTGKPLYQPQTCRAPKFARNPAGGRTR